jgi:hypothetical protein
MASFVHRPLQDNDIRLLQLVSAQTRHYRLVHVSLDSNPQYAALSYTWGDIISPDPINLEGGSFWVTKNLWDSLERLQTHARAQYLWVDAICINQMDDQEKSHQIRKMKTIYEKAHTVLVWLGQPEDEENARLAFRKIDYFNSIKVSHLTKHSGSWWWPRKPKPAQELFASMHAQISPSDKEIFDVPGSPTYRAWQGICSILTSNWWRRTWVCQEATVEEPRHFIIRSGVVTPPYAKIEFLYGPFSTTWSSLITAADIGDRIGETRGVDMDFMSDSQALFRRMMSIRALRLERRELDLLEAMQAFRNSSCQNPRDKLYAPLCIVPLSVQAFISPDYSQSLKEVYLSVARYYLAQNKLDFLGFVAKPHSSPSNSVLEEWPSWLPDWRNRLPCKNLGKNLYIPNQPQGTTKKVYNATNDSAVSTRLVGLTLEVQGFYCDIITAIVPFDVVDGRDATQQALALCNPSGGGKYFTGEPFLKVLCRIQAADVEYDFYERISRRGVSIDFDLLTKEPWRVTPKYMEAYQKSVKSLRYAIAGRSICRTRNGYLGLVHEASQIGDHVYAFLGCQVLYTLRRSGLRHGFEYIGECYLHGLMDGEAMRFLRDRSKQVENVCLI